MNKEKDPLMGGGFVEPDEYGQTENIRFTSTPSMFQEVTITNSIEILGFTIEMSSTLNLETGTSLKYLNYRKLNAKQINAILDAYFFSNANHVIEQEHQSAIAEILQDDREFNVTDDFEDIPF